MATTNPDNLKTPNAGDQYALVQDLGALADTTQLALNRRANAYVGTSAQRQAFSPNQEGVQWRDTDGIRGVYVWYQGEWTGDTGWVTIPYEPGYTSAVAGQLRVRTKQGVTIFEGGASKTSGSFSGEETVSTDVPPAFRPSGTTRASAVGMGQRTGVMLATNDGRFLLGMNQGVQGNSSWMGGTLVVFLD